MPIRSTTAPSIIPANQRAPVNIRARTVALRNQGVLASQIAENEDLLQSQILDQRDALQQPIQLPDEMQILDANGNLVAAIGYIIGKDGRVYPGGFFRNLYIGPDDPSDAVLFSDGISVQIGKNGWISVLDPFGAVGAWIGTQSDAPQNITGAANNGSGAIRITVTAHHYTTGDQIDVEAVGGVPNANGQWIISVFDANHFDLVGSTFAGAYTSGGTAKRYFAGAAFEQLAVGGATRITNAVDNGSGLIRITSTAHGLQTGWFVTVSGVGGVPNANGYFFATVINANTVDLQGSVFAGTYTIGGRIFAWAAAKLRAQANGSLQITNALIELIGTGGGSATITLDPTTGTLSIIANTGNMETFLDLNGLTIFNKTGSAPGTFIQNSNITLNASVTQTGTNPATYALAAGPQVTLLDSEIDIQDNLGTITIIIKSDGTITANANIISNTGDIIAAAGKVKAGTKFNAAGNDGLTTSFGQAASLTVMTDATGVFGTPGPSQSNGTVVVGVTLNFNVRQFTGGILST